MTAPEAFDRTFRTGENEYKEIAIDEGENFSRLPNFAIAHWVLVFDLASPVFQDVRALSTIDSVVLVGHCLSWYIGF